MMNNSLTKYYQKKKKKTEKGYKKKARKRYQNLSEEAKEKHPAIWSRTIWSYSFPNIKVKGWLSIEKIIQKCEKVLCNNVIKDWLMSSFILICNCKRKFVYCESIYKDFF